MKKNTIALHSIKATQHNTN